jgi:hypothetical protein
MLVPIEQTLPLPRPLSKSATSGVALEGPRSMIPGSSQWQGRDLTFKRPIHRIPKAVSVNVSRLEIDDKILSQEA